ncbi:MAG: DUF2256 domain-containing protein [Oleiphilus sp.]|nr:MAG: DUF2256 domain-containing protein [Oleiphilus sp.]
MPEKRTLDSKICPVCLRPFNWRKKWAAQWDQVRYCSERCRRHKSDTRKISQERSQ